MNGRFQRRRQILDAIAGHVVAARDQFEVFEADIQAVAVLEAQAVTFRQRPMRVFP